MRLTVILTLLGVLSFLACDAQVYYDRDSLKLELTKAKRDTNKVWLYIQLGQQYETNDPDSALSLYESALNLSEELKYMRGMISYYTNATYVYNLKGMYDTALTLNLKSVELAKAYGNPERLAVCLGNVGSSYTVLDQPEKAIDIFLQIIPLFEKLPKNVNQGVIYENLAVLYNDIGQPTRAISYGEQCLKIFREFNNDYGAASGLNNLALAYISLGEFEKSIKHLKEAQAIATRTNNQLVLMAVLLNLSDVNVELGNFVPMKKYSEDALKLARKLNDPLSESIALRALAMHYFYKNDALEAERYARQSLELALKNNFLKHAGKTYAVLAQIAILTKDFARNTFYYRKSDSIRNVMLNESLAKNIQNVEAKFETQKKEEKIRDLQQEAEIKDLSIKQSKLFNGVLIGSFLFLLIIVFLGRQSYQQKKQLLIQQNQVQEARISQLENEKHILAGEAVIKGQEEERARLAKDLHDGLGGLLSGVKFSLAHMKSNVILDVDNQLVFERSLDMLDHSITELRRVAHNMMPEVLVRFGLSEALKSYCESLRTSEMFKIDYQSVGNIAPIPDKTGIFVFRIAQELLNNVIKHAHASHVLVQLARTDNVLSLTVEDNGNGFNVDNARMTGGAGISSIQSRVDYLKGKLDIQALPGEGTSVYVTIPIT